MTLTEKSEHERERKRERSGEWRDCHSPSCNEFVHEQESEKLISLHFCSERCLEEWVEELEMKAEAYEDIKTELGMDEKAEPNDVIEEVIEVAQELTMRKEGFK